MDPKFQNKLKSQDWASLMEKLYAHSVYRLNWFGLKSEAKRQGKEPMDFANEAVSLLWEGKRKWNYVKEPDILNFLKGVVNSLIYNMIKSKESELLVTAPSFQEMSDSVFFDKMVEERLIMDDFIDKLENTMLQDSDMWLIFRSQLEGMKPKDIENKYGLDIKDIRNIQKRLRRHVKNITNL